MKKCAALFLSLLLILSLMGCTGVPGQTTLPPETGAASESAGSPETKPDSTSGPESTLPGTQPPEASSGSRYVLNNSSKKFHNPDCPSVRQMSPQNMQEVVCSREELVNQGYVPCKKCKP